jgi:uncharacterized protein (DUF433 family)
MMKKIVVDSKIHFGKPCLSGTRIPVQNVLELIEEGIPFNDIVREYYPQLTIEDIKTCVRYVVNLVASEEIHIREVSL